MKSSFYFPHEFNHSQTEKINLLILDNGAQALAVYWVACESIASSDESRIQRRYLRAISARLYVNLKEVEQVINYCVENDIFLEDDSGIFEKNIVEHKKFIQEKSLKGKKAAKARWKKEECLKPSEVIENKQLNAYAYADAMLKKERKKEINKEIFNNIDTTEIKPEFANLFNFGEDDE